MRRTLALIATGGALTLALTGCAGLIPDEDATGPGPATDLVEVTGSFGTTPRVSFPTPVIATETECDVLIEGSGDTLEPGQKALVKLSVYNAATGVTIQQADRSADPIPAVLDEGTLLPGLFAGLQCATEGSRVLIAVPPADGFGEQGSVQLGIAPDDTLFFVVDVERTYLPRANGVERAGVAGFPAVVLAPDGRPGITVPSDDAPDETQVAVLKQGHGETVESGDSVTVHYTGVLWDTNEVFDSSWQSGSPASFTVGDGGDVIPGFSEAIVGQQVGSQVIATITPEDGYGEQGSGAVPPNATLVFVVDILGID
ncbi:FKBP-type peptidyl-prolyl cis-trans isomerase [Agromyces rhizosphaerae]|uniref:FKBP-type peptidyl-prolyl cis-trans isomerase n=1 Tax=Agromyces rhizosphaerae TaxID=88374 RepID=UPI00248FC643|nr:FKBP-type peptidyl-prolyl cis-trans isomerase [Agromyces rhizosphaerae]